MLTSSDEIMSVNNIWSVLREMAKNRPTQHNAAAERQNRGKNETKFLTIAKYRLGFYLRAFSPQFTAAVTAVAPVSCCLIFVSRFH